MNIKGFADNKETELYLRKYKYISPRKTPWFQSSPIAIGTHLGNMTETDSILYQDSIEYCLRNGINFIDTALNYRGMRSERDIGIVLDKLINKEGILKRNEIIISTKAGMLPGDIDAKLVPSDYLKEILLKNDIIKESDISTLGHQKHVLSPNYYAFAIEQSRKHLNLDTIDIYYIHNPEISMHSLGQSLFYQKLSTLFEHLEQEVHLGHIQFFGMATWDAFLYEQSEDNYFSLKRVVDIAEEVGGKNHHFKFVQLPYNLHNTKANTKRNQLVNNELVPFLDAAKKLDIIVTTSAPFHLGKLLHENYSAEDCLKYILETETIHAAMLGMKNIEHVKENLEIIHTLT
ncbi:MAG: aldo/keto reductase [Bacillaceae bacterium]